MLVFKENVCHITSAAQPGRKGKMMPESITINYYHDKSAGSMTLNLDHFFPCLVKDWKIIGPLIRDFASEETKNTLLNFLQNKRCEYISEVQYRSERLGDFDGKAQIVHANAMAKKTEKNIEQ